MATFKSWGKSFWAAVCLSVFSTIVGFRVYGDATPQVSLAIGDSYMETYSRESIQVGINYYSGDPIVVKLTVTPPDRANPGELVLDSAYKTVPNGYPALADNEYYISLNSAGMVSVGIVSMDGTATSGSMGFTVQAEVVTPAWSNAYVSATQRVYVHNVAPAIDATLENASAWMVSGGVASKYPIRWQIRSDVEADLAAGITVRFEGCENAFTTNVTEATGGSFVPDFGSWIGSQTVTMTIEDKDDASQTWTYLYDVRMPPEYTVIDGVLTCVELNGATNFEIPQGVVRIGESVFADCSSLTSVVIPDSVTNIADNAFRNCILLTSVVMEGDCPEVGVDAFYGVDPSCVVRLPANNSTYTVNDGKWQGMNVYILTIVDGVLTEVNLNGATNVVIPSCVTNIGEYAFWGLYVTGITIPDSVTSIGDGAFSDSGLRSVTIPDSVTNIGASAFYDCNELTSVTIGNGVTSIGEKAFGRCVGLTSVTIPDSVAVIGHEAFWDCIGLTSVIIGDGVTSCGQAFRGCRNVTSATIPQYFCMPPGSHLLYDVLQSITNLVISVGATNIGDSAFFGCSSLMSVLIPDGVTSIGKRAFQDCDGLARVKIPDSVTSIGDHAFDHCGLTNVTIPNSVTSIGDYAFSGCWLTNIIFNGNAPEVSDSAFDDDPDIIVYVRRGSTGWGVDIPGTWQGMRIEYLPPVISVECATATLVADADYLTAKASLSVRLSQACDEDVTVTLTPSFEDGYSGNWADYVRFSTAESEVGWLPDAKSPTVVIPAGSTESGAIYVFALRSDEHTVGTGHGLCLTPSATGADDLMGRPRTLAISANAPRIVSPAAGVELSTLTGSPMEIPIEVTDTYADMLDTLTGYSVYFKANASSAWTELPEKFKMDESGLVGITTGNLPAIAYSSAGDFVSQIYVVSPISGRQSDPVSFTVHAFAPPPTATATTMDDKGDVYTEGDQATVQVSLSEVNGTGSAVYAFLKAGNGANAAMFGGRTMFVVCDDTDPAKTKGLRIGVNQSTAEGVVSLLDNPAAATRQVPFTVVLCSTEQYRSANVLGGFQSGNLTITVNNAEPSISGIELNGLESDYDGYVFSGLAVFGVNQTFQAVVQDAANDLATEFETKWTVYRNGIEKWGETIAGNPNVRSNAYVCAFPQPGTWTVKCQVKDKDTEDWGEHSYSVGVEVGQPAVTLTVDDSNGYMETDGRESIAVGLNYYDYNAEEIVVKVAVTPPDRTTNPGAFVLDPSYKAIPAGYPALASNEYYVTFGSAETVPVTIVAMDGTDASCLRGFTVQAEVVTPAWSNAYVSATQRVFVQNVAPSVGSVTPENPSAWMVSGGVASKYPIRWQIRSDVEADLAAGITVRFEGCENAFTTNVTEATGGSFVPDFGSWIGSQTVTMTIEDKDGGMLAYSYLYEVLPSKFLKTLAHGPGVGMVASALSQRYERARGRGEGHVYAYGATLSMASNFVQTWNCSRASTVNLTGSGYKVGDVDNGWLDNGRDCALTARGDAADTAMQATDTAGFYRYGDDERDSFLYLWIFHPVDESGMPSDIVPGDTATPEILGRSNPVLSAALPSMVGDDGFYPLTTVEAVFSKEWLAADNLGDINQDGVPDMFAMKTWRAGGASLTALATGGETLANDMVNIGELNPDESYLPRTSYGEFTNEVPFTVRLQLRGMGDGLNDAVSQTTDMDVSERVYAIPMTNALGEAYWGWSNACSLNELEFCAWRAYAEANGLDWTDPLNWTEWSPERPTDPTVSDTDGDGMPDGFEYRYWYLAHVGYFETNADGQTVFRQLEGCRFDPKDPLGFQVVPAQEIAALMDPLTPGEDAATRDSDNDGVSDLAEIQAGQDPFDFHDAIHLPYYEIEDGVLLSVYMGEEASAVIPHTVTSIGEAAFYGCSGLASVTIPDSVTSIGMAAFYGCSGLEDVTIPGSVTNIGSYAFYDCGNLTRIRLPKRLEGHIDESVFDGCPGTLTVTYYESPYTIRFHRNDASDAKVEARDFDYGVETHLPSLAKLGWARRGCDFLGWATSRANADAGKVWKKDWAAVASPVAAGETLDVYAVWALKPGSYAIQFIRNDGAGTWRTVGFNYGEKTRMPSLANGLGWARRGYEFKGWALTTADANAGKVWKEDWAYVATPVKAGEVLTVYAVWALKPGYYQIRFNKNDGGGKWRTLGFECDKSTKLSTIAGLGWERPGYTFKGWASNKANADAGKVWKPDGEWVTNATAEGRTLSIYAIWE